MAFTLISVFICAHVASADMLILSGSMGSDSNDQTQMVTNQLDQPLQERTESIGDFNKVSSEFVGVNGVAFTLKGKEVRFIGINIGDLMILDDKTLNSQLIEARRMGVQVIRFFGVRSDKSNQQNIQAIERVLQHANNHAPDVKFIIALLDFYKDGDAGYFPQGMDPELYYDDDGKPHTAKILRKEFFNALNYDVYRQWVTEAVIALGNRNQIMAWELGNELQVHAYPGCFCNPTIVPDNYCGHPPNTPNCPMTHPGGYCDPNGDGSFEDGLWELGWYEFLGYCEEFALINFAYEIGGIIQQHASQLVATGFLSVWHATDGNPDDTYISKIYDSWDGRTSPFDFVTIHVYDNRQANNPGEPRYHHTDKDQKWARFRKPYLVEEAGFTGAKVDGSTQKCPDFEGGVWQGVTLGDCSEDRYDCLKKTMDIYFNVLGCDGFMQWGFGFDRGADGCVGISNIDHTDWDSLFTLYHDYFLCEDSQPCSTWDGDINACNAHGYGHTQDCAYYTCSGACRPRGTSNCQAGCQEYCTGGYEDLPCSTWDGDINACNAHGYGHTQDCAYYTCSGACKPRGTPNCQAGCQEYCNYCLAPAAGQILTIFSDFSGQFPYLPMNKCDDGMSK